MNINLTASTDTLAPADYTNVHIKDINEIKANVCKNLRIHNTLNYLTTQQLESLLGIMRHGGVISIISPDTMELAKALYWGNINLMQFSQAVMQNITHHSIIELRQFFEQHQYIIEIASNDLTTMSLNLQVKRP